MRRLHLTCFATAEISSILPPVLLAAFYVAASFATARAAITTTGCVDPPDPATWTEYVPARIGGAPTFDGAVRVDGGSSIVSRFGWIGPGGTGVVTVDGGCSSWTIGADLEVGCGGSGSLNVTGGGAVSDDYAYIGSAPGSVGIVNVDGDGSTWSNTVVSIGINFGGFPSEGSGTLNVTHGGTVTGTYLNIRANNGTFGPSVNVDGTGSTLTTSTLRVYGGLSGNEINVTRGGAINTIYSTQIIGVAGLPPVVTVDGAGSMWTDNVLNLGGGILNVSGGATASCNGAGIGAPGPAPVGLLSVLNVDGTDSTWTVNVELYVGGSGISGALFVTAGGTVFCHGPASVSGGYSFPYKSTGVVTVDGAGSKWINSSSLTLLKYGTLNIIGGGTVSTTSVSINSQSLLAIDVGNGSLLNINSGSGEIDNDGTVRILAGVGATTGSVYSPISAGTWEGDGIYQAVGGTWDETEHEFTVSGVLSGNSGTSLTIILADIQRTMIEDGASGWSLGASFLAKIGDHTALDFTATAIEGETLADLEALLGPGQEIKGAWDFIVAGDGYADDDPVYLSFDIGAGYSRGDLQVWHFDGSELTAFDAVDLTCNDGWASFTATDFSGYAVTVPEPGAFTLLLAAGLGLLAHARRKRKQRNGTLISANFH